MVKAPIYRRFVVDRAAEIGGVPSFLTVDSSIRISLDGWSPKTFLDSEELGARGNALLGVYKFKIKMS